MEAKQKVASARAEAEALALQRQQITPDLLALRAELADSFFGLLTPQDSAKPRLHITVQNKVEPSAARRLLQVLDPEFTPRPLSIVGIDAHYYRGGPWEPIQAWKFRG